MTEPLTPEKLAELRRDAESWLMVGGERVLPLLNAYDALRAERDALAAKVAECEALMVELQPDPVLVGDSWIPFRDLAEVCGNFMRSSTEYAREVKALAAAVERVRKLADRVDRHTEVEPGPAEFRDADTGVWWEVSDAIRTALDGERPWWP